MARRHRGTSVPRICRPYGYGYGLHIH
ncbi:hypothetical protein CGRA01v4_09076 [Colletotrichum graminicola]|nr:hypothetical protein CGRA01v4_09076 [Colletotrichum graminicola]